VPTSFNFLGPLTNPARPTMQVVGVSDERMLLLMAEVLARRGTRAKVFRGEDGLDEISLTGPSIVLDVGDGEVRESRMDPRDHGFDLASAEDLRGGDAGESARVARAVLSGDPGPKRDVVLLNAGAALVVADVAADVDAGVALAAASIDEGKAAATLDRWIAVSNEAPA
jgi:anthranilate phosphoribosyltransferase